jgi:hypothetical protein
MQMVAIRMSDTGNRDLSPPRGMRAKREPESSRPEITRRSAVKAIISKSLNHPSEAMR